MRPPLLTRSWRAGPPDFVGVGVQRAGTSWWYSMLEHHPEVQPRPRKELHFFDRFWGEELTDEKLAIYHGEFLRPAGKVCGEWTPRYLFDVWTPPLLRRAAPDAKLLIMLRDPVERFRSGVTHAVERGWKVDETLVSDAVQRGFYHRQLTRLLEHFPRDQVLVLQYEQCRADTAALFGLTLQFLGLGPGPAPAARSRPVNHSTIEVNLLPSVLQELRHVYEDDVRRLETDFPTLDLQLWPHFARSAGPVPPSA